MSILYFFRPRSTPRGSRGIHALRRSTTLYAIWPSTTLPKKSVDFAFLRSVLLAFERFCALCRPPPPAGTPCATAPSCAFVRPRAPSCALVRPCAPSCDVVRPRATLCDPSIPDLGWLLKFFRESSFELRQSCVTSAA